MQAHVFDYLIVSKLVEFKTLLNLNAYNLRIRKQISTLCVYFNML